MQSYSFEIQFFLELHLIAMLLFSILASAAEVENPAVQACKLQEGAKVVMQAADPAFGKAGITNNNLCCFDQGCLSGWTVYGLTKSRGQNISKAIEAYRKNRQKVSGQSLADYCLANGGKFVTQVNVPDKPAGDWAPAPVCKFSDNSAIAAETLFNGPDVNHNAALNAFIDRHAYIGRPFGSHPSPTMESEAMR